MDSSATAEADARDQLRSLISARVDDTNVYDRDDESLSGATCR